MSTLQTFVIVRSNILADCFGADILARYNGWKVIVTDQDRTPSVKLLEQTKNSNVFIVGGYYCGNLQKFIDNGSKLTVFYNLSDEPCAVEHIAYKASINKGFATYAVDSCVPDVCEYNVYRLAAQNLDKYQYGFPDEISFKFQYGIYVLNDSNDNLSKIKLFLDGTFSYEEVLNKGSIKQKENIAIATERLNKAQEFKLGDKTILVSYGASPVVESCMLLASKTGIGMLIRYNYDRTFVSCGVSENSGENAGLIMKSFINGGGSLVMGGGSVEGTLSAEELFAKYSS